MGHKGQPWFTWVEGITHLKRINNRYMWVLLLIDSDMLLKNSSVLWANAVAIGFQSDRVCLCILKMKSFHFLMSFSAVCVWLFSWLFGPKWKRENNLRYVLKYLRKEDVLVLDGSNKESNQEQRVCVPCETMCTLNDTIINPNHSVYFLFMKLNNLLSCLKPKPPAG